MEKLAEIKATYDWLLSLYDAEVEQMVRDNDIAGIDRAEARRDVFERGFFVLLFAQFEKAVTETFEDASRARGASPDWGRRRGWDAVSALGKRIPFEAKLAMVMDRQSPSFGKIIATYGTRNHCAHGGTTNPVGSIMALEADLYRWQGELRR
ncbi:MAG: hypothetical protein JJU21_10230 [Salinarimonas sp.]|nr:hypothetical protein [Salinarimonas sp.]